jgi:hypothetical protein
MKGAVSAALLAAIALGAAGCGATTSTSAALRDARDSGGAQPRAVRLERWRISNGDAVDAVLVQARFCGTSNGYTAPKVDGRCVPSDVYFAIHPGETGGPSTFFEHGDLRMADEARKARRAFRLFPAIPDLLVRCAIPHRRGGTVAGLCETKLSRPLEVDFLEHWPLSKPNGHRNSGGWAVTLDRDGRVVAVRAVGATPPSPRASAAGRAAHHL